ncbi:unnamed protein product [Parajaminaea phylloscopi]
MTGLGGILSGYGSESDAESEGEAPVPSPPEPKAKSSGLGGLMSALPPPKATLPSAPKRKQHQIRIEAAPSRGDHNEAEPPRKIPKASTSSGVASTSKHGLFGMLPAPTRTGPPSPPRDREDAGHQATLTITETVGPPTANKKKGNADFRAMLGIGPKQATAAGHSAKPPPKARDLPQGHPEPLEPLGTTTSQGPARQVQSAGAKAEISLGRDDGHVAAGESATQRGEQAAAILEPVEIDFFGLAAPPSSSTGASRKSRETSSAIQPVKVNASRPRSAAPQLEEADPYPGWVRNPDGSWVPVTPEAQAAFASHQAAQRLENARNGQDGNDEEHLRHIERLRAQGVDVDALASASAQDRTTRPLSSMTSSTTDAKYAQAAASIAPSNRPSDDGTAVGADGKRKDKMTSTRARQKGQLSSLFAQAEEKRESLEEKWAQGRANRNAAKARYGF